MLHIITLNHGIQQEYQWYDDAEFHQYYCEMNTTTDPTIIANFTYMVNLHGRIYSWTDNLGYHQYYR